MRNWWRSCCDPGSPGENAINVATRILAEFEGLAGLARVGYAELFEQRGLSHAKTCEILAALELGRRIASLAPEERRINRLPAGRGQFGGGRNVAPATRAFGGSAAEHPESWWWLSVQIYIGTVNSSVVRPAEVLRPAMRENAPSIIVVHNHPSGDPTPSPEDVAVTRDLVSAGKLMDIELLDHLVIGLGGRFVSLKESKLGFD